MSRPPPGLSGALQAAPHATAGPQIHYDRVLNPNVDLRHRELPYPLSYITVTHRLGAGDGIVAASDSMKADSRETPSSASACVR
jgi:hypothetical protein